MAYVINRPSRSISLSYLPQEINLPKTSETVVLDAFQPNSDYDGLYSIVKDVIDEGQTYPQETMGREHFEKYYLSDDVFVVRTLQGDVMGAFYVKPNFPGRSSHICNAGFVVHRDHRGKGIGEVLFRKYLPIAKDLGYEGSFFNLVYASNQGSLRLCRKLGFQEIGVIPKAGKMKGLGYVDAYQFYYDLTTLT